MRTPLSIIRRIFDTEFRLFVDRMGFDVDTDIAWPNIAFTPDPDKLYFGVNHIFGTTRAASCGEDGFERMAGIYQVIVYERLNQSIADAEIAANKIIDHFRGGTVLQLDGVRVVITNSYASNPVPDDLRFQLPVFINWYCYAQKSITRDKDPILGGF